MSWADDIRCLYCDGRLPLYRKITSGQFCNAAHRKAYWQEHERLAIERLHQTHDSLRAYRPSGAVEAILGKTETPGPDMTGFLRLRLSPMADFLPLMVAAEPLAYEMSGAARRPFRKLQIDAGRPIPLGNFVPLPRFALPRWSADQIVGLNPQPLECAQPLIQPANDRILFDLRISRARAVGIPRMASLAPVHSFPCAVQPVQRTMRPVYPVSLAVLRPFSELLPNEAPKHPDEVPQLDKLLAIARPLFLENAHPTVQQPAAIPVVLRAQLPLDAVRLDAGPASAELIPAGLRQLCVNRVPPVQPVHLDSARALDLRVVPETPALVLTTPPLRPRLRMAKGRRYPVETREAPVVIAAQEPSGVSAAPPRISLPERKNLSVVEAPVQIVPQPDPIPAPRGLLPLACNAKPSQPAADTLAAPAALSIPQPLRTQPLRPASKLEPLDSKPTSDFMANPPVRTRRPAEEPPAEALHIWSAAADFWKNAPRDLKIMVVALPLLLGLALHPSLPKVRVVAPKTAAGLEHNFEQAVSEQWKNVRQTVFDRAAVALDEDFRTGLDDWASRGDATTEWSFDATGFVRPGPLALYRPSLGLTDYQMQFLGLIDKKALSWVVRASDFNNYYVVKLVVLKAGPLPTIGLTRYAVVNGKADSRADVVAPIDARPDMLYRVRMDVHGDTYSLAVQGQMVDSWSEPRLRHGGVGFFTARGEESRLRWVQVTHQYDMLGRLCAYLAPYNIPTSSGSWQQ